MKLALKASGVHASLESEQACSMLALKASGTGSIPVWDDNFLLSSTAKMVGDGITCNGRAVTGNPSDSNFKGWQRHMYMSKSEAAQYCTISTSSRGDCIPLGLSYCRDHKGATLRNK